MGQSIIGSPATCMVVLGILVIWVRWLTGPLTVQCHVFTIWEGPCCAIGCTSNENRGRFSCISCKLLAPVRVDVSPYFTRVYVDSCCLWPIANMVIPLRLQVVCQATIRRIIVQNGIPL